MQWMANLRVQNPICTVTLAITFFRTITAVLRLKEQSIFKESSLITTGPYKKWAYVGPLIRN